MVRGNGVLVWAHKKVLAMMVERIAQQCGHSATELYTSKLVHFMLCILCDGKNI